MQKQQQKNPQKKQTPNHGENSTVGIVTEMIKWQTENSFSYDLKNSHGDIWRAFQVSRVLGVFKA